MIEFQNVTKTYDNGTEAIRGIDLKIEDGEFVFLVGPSGSGKSTIINLLTAELTPTSGTPWPAAKMSPCSRMDTTTCIRDMSPIASAELSGPGSSTCGTLPSLAAT